MTSRTKKKNKGNINQDINYYNQEFKIKIKNQNIKKINNNNNNFAMKNENNIIKIKRIYDNLKNNNIEKNKMSGFFTSRKNK